MLDGQPTRVHVTLSRNNDLGYVEPFGFELQVHADPETHAWQTARLTYQKQSSMLRTVVHAAWLEVLKESPGITTNKAEAMVEERTGVKSTKQRTVRRELEEQGLIAFEVGTNKSKHWTLVE